MERILITGASGLVGRHFVDYFLRNTNMEIYALSRRPCRWLYENRTDTEAKRLNTLLRDLEKDSLREDSQRLKQDIAGTDYILHLAAETSVDKSIRDPKPFLQSNILSTINILEVAKGLEGLKGFLYFSSNEVFGPAGEGVEYKEEDRYNCTNPYSASKASGEEIALAYANTYKVPVFVTHTMNCFGEGQPQDKFIPICIRKISKGSTIQIHSDPSQRVSGSRRYIHCRNIADGVNFLLDKFGFREKYNIVGEVEYSNLDLALKIGEIMGREVRYEMVDFHSTRPGLELRYSMSGDKMSGMGWRPPVSFERSLEGVVNWYLEEGYGEA